jgi:hypothetical protein
VTETSRFPSYWYKATVNKDIYCSKPMVTHFFLLDILSKLPILNLSPSDSEVWNPHRSVLQVPFKSLSLGSQVFIILIQTQRQERLSTKVILWDMKYTYITSWVSILVTETSPLKFLSCWHNQNKKKFIAPKSELEVSLLTLNQECDLFSFIVCDKHWAFDIHVIQPMSPEHFHYVCPQPTHMLQTLSVLVTLLGTTSINCNDTFLVTSINVYVGI